MTDSFGVMDFSSLKKENQVNGASRPLDSEITVSEANLEEIITASQQYLTFLLVTSSRVPGGAAFVDDVRDAIERYTGTIRFALLDADLEPRVAAALRLQSLPAAMVFIKGQLQPLFEGIVTKEQLEPVLDNLVQIASHEGLHTEEVAPKADQAQLPPELEAAYQAMEQGDFDTAKTHFVSYLEGHPQDEEAKKGLAMSELLKRTEGADLQAGREAAAANPADVCAQLHGADLDLLGGHVEDAFSRLLTTFRDADSDEDKTIVRTRLLELFDVVGASDERVQHARKRLSRLMF